MADNAHEMVLEYASQGSRLRDAFFEANHELVVEVGMVMALSLAQGGKILYCGNGGSAADAQHLAGELVNRFLMERPPLPAVALTTDTSILTAIGNDYGFDQVFQKQVEALGNPGDVLIAISTSGNSVNVIKAIDAARERGLVVVAVTANDGGRMAALCDHHINVPSDNTPLAQEVHAAIGHLLVRLVDYYLFEEVGELMERMKAQGREDVDAQE